jgi:hypothetical protein
MFHDTRPDLDASLKRASEFQRALQDSGRTLGAAGSTRLGGLSPSLLSDLQRFERQHQPGHGLDLLEVLAAALRHGRSLRLQVQHDDAVLPLAVRPITREFRSPVPAGQLLALRMAELRVLSVEPAPAEDGAAPEAAPAAAEPHTLPLAPLLWELALRGGRSELLPEIAGIAAYRVMPGADLHLLNLAGTLAAAVARLRQNTSTLREIAQWPGFDHDRAQRMLNGLYLQSALMVCRAHPGAIHAA